MYFDAITCLQKISKITLLSSSLKSLFLLFHKYQRQKSRVWHLTCWHWAHQSSENTRGNLYYNIWTVDSHMLKAKMCLILHGRQNAPKHCYDCSQVMKSDQELNFFFLGEKEGESWCLVFWQNSTFQYVFTRTWSC